MTARLVKLLINSGIAVMDAVKEMETNQALQQWVWYAGALQQHHYAMLLAVDIFTYPMRQEADRIWRGLDYVFEVPDYIPQTFKGRWVVSRARDQMALFCAAQKMRCQTEVDESIVKVAQPSAEPAPTTSTENQSISARVAHASDAIFPSAPEGTKAATTNTTASVGPFPSTYKGIPAAPTNTVPSTAPFPSTHENIVAVPSSTMVPIAPFPSAHESMGAATANLMALAGPTPDLLRGGQSSEEMQGAGVGPPQGGSNIPKPTEATYFVPDFLKVDGFNDDSLTDLHKATQFLLGTGDEMDIDWVGRVEF